QSEQDPKAVHFFFLAEPDPAADLDGLRELATQGEEFVLTERVLYLHTPNGFGRSRLVERMHRFIEAETTARGDSLAAEATKLASRMLRSLRVAPASPGFPGQDETRRRESWCQRSCRRLPYSV
ncbi:MAG: hypothetical protein OXG91_14650, partial [bacterium]|nr:hypothetical protein [bacterium]